MKAGMINVKNVSYKRYEDLIRQRDEVKKEAYQYDLAYIREFGDLILRVFEKKIECIRKKKTIEYCQMIKNHGGMVDQAALQKYLEKEMVEFQNQFRDLTKDVENSKRSTQVSEKDMLEIKRIYHRIAKQIHPDMNTEIQRNGELMDIWNRVTVAYKCNDLKELRELEVVLKSALDDMGVFVGGIDIPNIEARIMELEKEIAKIRDTDPYLYGALLEDPKAVEQKKADLKQELKDYEDYEAQLEDILHQTMSQGVTLTWQMN